MVTFTAPLEKYDRQGEKTGWTFLRIPSAMAEKLNPGVKKSYRVKGKLDDHAIKQVALIPIGEGDFIIPVNATMRKALGKRKGAMVKARLSPDSSEFAFNEDMMACLEDDPQAMEGFKKLSGAEQKYFSKWIDSAKTTETRTKRIGMMLNAMHRGLRYGEMIRAAKG